MKALVIARFTLQEAIRRRLILAGVLLSLAYVGLFALGFSLMFHEVGEGPAGARGRVFLSVFVSTLTILGLYAANFLATFLALFLPVGSISGEVDGGTLHAVLARPIRRAEFVLGRWLAYVLLLSIYVAVMASLVLLVAHLIGGHEAPEPVRAIGLLVLEAAFLLSLSLFGSAVLPTLANGVVIFSLFGLAWLAGIIEFIGRLIPNETMVNLGIVVSLLVPSDAIWRGASFYIQAPSALSVTAVGGGLPFAGNTPPTIPLLVWSTAYVLVLLLGAMRAFSRRDL